MITEPQGLMWSALAEYGGSGSQSAQMGGAFKAFFYAMPDPADVRPYLGYVAVAAIAFIAGAVVGVRRKG
jgi:hypothetical protein